MGRNPKQGIAYFQADVDMFQDRKIKRLLRSAGSKGFTIYIYLLTYIYRDKGYYYEWDQYSAFDISNELNFSESVVEESVKACCSIGLFNEDLYSEKSILSSESIQNRWQKIVTEANRTITNIDPELQIIEGEPLFLRQKIPKPTEETPDKSRESTQRKEKESKEKNSTENNVGSGDPEFPEVCEFINEATQIAEYLLASICQYDPTHRYVHNPPSLTRWILDIERAIRLDKRTVKQLKYVIDWVYQGNGDFWAGNVESGESLRKHFDKIKNQIRRNTNGTASKESTIESEITKFN